MSVDDSEREAGATMPRPYSIRFPLRQWDAVKVLKPGSMVAAGWGWTGEAGLAVTGQVGYSCRT